MPYISPAGSDSLQRFNLVENVEGLVVLKVICSFYQIGLSAPVCSTAVTAASTR